MNGEKELCMICDDEITGDRIAWRVDGADEKSAHPDCIMRLAKGIALHELERSLEVFLKRLGDDAPKEMRDAFEDVKRQRANVESTARTRFPISMN
jgi:hypothetical protein